MPLQMKATRGGGYWLDVEGHRFEIELEDTTTEGHYGRPVQTKHYYCTVDGTRLPGGPYEFAWAARARIERIVERMERKAAEEREKEELWRWARKLFPGGLPKQVEKAIEDYKIPEPEAEPDVDLDALGTLTTVTPQKASVSTSGENQVIREWARKQGLAVGDRGRLPTEVREKYFAAVDSGELDETTDEQETATEEESTETVVVATVVPEPEPEQVEESEPEQVEESEQETVSETAAKVRNSAPPAKRRSRAKSTAKTTAARKTGPKTATRKAAPKSTTDKAVEPESEQVAEPEEVPAAASE